MSERGGAVVNAASTACTIASTGTGCRGAIKTRLPHLAEQLLGSLAPAPQVNAVALAVVRSTSDAALDEDRNQEMTRRYSLQRLGIATNGSGTLAFIPSDEDGWITSQTLFVDGGLTVGGGDL